MATQQMSLADLQAYSALQQSATNRVNEDSDRIADMMTRLVQPTVSRVEQDTNQMQDMFVRLVQPPAERVHNENKRLQRIHKKLATTPYQRTMEDSTVLTGMLARMQRAGFRPSPFRPEYAGFDPSDPPVVQGEQGTVSGLASTLPSPAGMALSSPAQGSTPIGNGSGLGAAPSAGLPNIAPTYDEGNPLGSQGIQFLSTQSPPTYQQPGGFPAPQGLPPEPKFTPPSGLTQSPPPAPEPIPAPTAPDTSTCNECEAIVYAAQLIANAIGQLCQCLQAINPGQSSPPQQDQSGPTDQPPYDWPDFTEDSEPGVVQPPQYAPAKPPELEPFASEPGGAVGGSTTALQLPGVR